MKIGIFGGSFNPIHLGHFEIVRQVLEAQIVDQVVIVPTMQNPLKDQQPELSQELRLSLIEATFAELEAVRISLIEWERGGLSYSCDTLEYFKDLYPQDELFLLMGADSYQYFSQWKNKNRILELASLLIFPRKGLHSLKPIPTNRSRIKWLDVGIPEVSATEIRNQQENWKETLALLHPAAAKLWKQHFTPQE